MMLSFTELTMKIIWNSLIDKNLTRIFQLDYNRIKLLQYQSVKEKYFLKFAKCCHEMHLANQNHI